jgi:hypothetical protein
MVEPYYSHIDTVVTSGALPAQEYERGVGDE